MRGIRAIINAVLVATLLKPMLRRSIARWRREARESAEATVIIPAQGLLEAILSEQIDPEASSPQPTSDEVGDVTGPSILRIVLVFGAVAVVTAASASAIVAMRRRRRAAIASEPEAKKELVAVPVEVPAEVSETADTLAATPDSSR